MPHTNTPPVDHLATARRGLDLPAALYRDEGDPPSREDLDRAAVQHLSRVQAHALIAVVERLDRVIALLERPATPIGWSE